MQDDKIVISHRNERELSPAQSLLHFGDTSDPSPMITQYLCTKSWYISSLWSSSYVYIDLLVQYLPRHPSSCLRMLVLAIIGKKECSDETTSQIINPTYFSHFLNRDWPPAPDHQDCHTIHPFRMNSPPLNFLCRGPCFCFR